MSGLRCRCTGLWASFVLVAGVLAGSSRAGPAGAAGVAQGHTLAGGSSHSLVVKADGTLWTFGRNSYGQLGTATNVGVNPNPVPVQVMSNVAQVAAGGDHSLVVKTDGTLWSFGVNRSRELGIAGNSATDGANPVPVEVMTNVAMAAAGVSHSLAVKTDGTLWSFGDAGQLGRAASGDPGQVMTDAAEVAAGDHHSLVVKTDGTLWSFGNNQYGQLGRPSSGNKGSDPGQVMTGAAHVAAGGTHSLVVKTDGTLWSFGGNASGQLGTSVNVRTATPNPVPVQVMADVAQAAAGEAFSLVLKTDGTLWGFGGNEFGQLGTATNVTVGPNPVPVKIMTGVAQVAAGWNYSLVVKTDGTLWTFGYNGGSMYGGGGQLGTAANACNGNPNPTPTLVMSGVATASPTATVATAGASVPAVAGRPTSSVATAADPRAVGTPVRTATAATRRPARTLAIGSGHLLAIRPDGRVWSLGSSGAGQLGRTAEGRSLDPSFVLSDLATQVPFTGAAQVAVGAQHSLVLKADGTLWTFGDNCAGQMGTRVNAGTMFRANATPTRVLSNVVRIAAAADASFAVTSDGTLWGFGTATAGQFAGAVENGVVAATPTRLLSAVADVAVGGTSVLVVKTDGSLWSFGNGSATPRRVLTSVVDIAAATDHALAITKGGTVWGFGSNDAGQLGVAPDSPALRTIAVPRRIIAGGVRVAAGERYSLVLKADGTLWSFGDNAKGQLGRATETDWDAKPSVALRKVRDMSAGATQALVKGTDGTVWAFGTGLGLITTEPRDVTNRLVDCGGMNLASGWPTTLPPPRDLLDCILNAFAKGTPARFGLSSDLGGAPAPRMLRQEYEVIGPRRVRVTTDPTRVVGGGDEIIVEECTELSGSFTTLTTGGCTRVSSTPITAPVTRTTITVETAKPVATQPITVIVAVTTPDGRAATAGYTVLNVKGRGTIAELAPNADLGRSAYTVRLPAGTYTIEAYYSGSDSIRASSAETRLVVADT